MRIEPAVDRIDDHADGILAFWEGQGALTGDAARQRLREVLCVLVGDGDEVLGVNSAVAAEIPLIGNRRFWLYRRLIAPEAGDDWDVPMLAAAFDLLARRAEPGGPLGLCLAVPPELGNRYPEAVWPSTEMLYAGRLADGQHVRIRYFEGASIA